MKTISRLYDLEPFGIIPLTGEADALSFRILCDLTRRGCKIVSETFGIKPDSFQENWNQGSENNPHVGCIMLPEDAWRPIGVIALHDDGCHTILATPNGLFGLSGEERYIHQEVDWDTMEVVKPATISRDGETFTWPKSCYGEVNRVFSLGSGPRVGTRNIHAMSGRVS